MSDKYYPTEEEWKEIGRGRGIIEILRMEPDYEALMQDIAKVMGKPNT